MTRNRKELSSLVLEHQYNPQVEVVPREEAKRILRSLGAKAWQIPWIRASDPLARAVGAKPGDLLRLRRRSPMAEVVEAYRFVVPA